MKTTDKILGFASLAGVMLAMGACSTEPNFQPSMAGIPQASDYQIGISVDEFNNVELNILDKDGQKAKGVYPVWYVNESPRPSTALTYRDLITIAGEYPVEMKVGNGNGVSEGSVTGTIRIDKTIFDFTPYINGLTNGSFKEWAVDGTKQGHMGCGPDTNDPTGWWNGNPGDKEAEGVYANTLTFAYTGAETTGTYVFDPGASGTIYVNTGVHSLPGYTVNNPDDGNDFRVEAKTVESTFTLSAEGPNLYLVLPANTPFPYIPSEAGFANPKYRISKFSKNEITLVQDLDGISWQYIIAPKAEADVTTTGFKYDFEHNLWKDASVVIASTWFANNDWAELGEQPTVELTPTKGIKLHTPADTGNSQWQGQVHVETDIEVHSGITYDFSCNVNVPKAGAVTVKVQKLGDDGIFFVESPYEVEPNGSIVWFADMEGFDGTLKIAFDFGGFGDCDIEVSNIVFKEHQYDDGTKIPNAAVENPPVISDEDNLFANFEVLKWSTWFADSSWSDAAITQPEIVFMPGGYSFVCPEGIGGDQWQGQVHVWTNVGISAEHKYDFMLTIESDKDISGVTVKIQKGDSLDADKDADDAVAFSVDRVNVEAGEPYTYFFKGKPGFDSTNLQVCMDYAGAPGKANISVSDIRMQIAK
ncbi:MAG: hypothetical protein K2H22_07020 [Muribaculaceae bacterium]|nr:hypothetical protein [Muribaculaceae bacterium]